MANAQHDMNPSHVGDYYGLILGPAWDIVDEMASRARETVRAADAEQRCAALSEALSELIESLDFIGDYGNAVGRAMTKAERVMKEADTIPEPHLSEETQEKRFWADRVATAILTVAGPHGPIVGDRAAIKKKRMGGEAFPGMEFELGGRNHRSIAALIFDAMNDKWDR